jgi:hypothetical protein
MNHHWLFRGKLPQIILNLIAMLGEIAFPQFAPGFSHP